MIVRWRIQRPGRRAAQARLDFVGGRRLPVDLYATQEAYILRATVPGVRPEDIDIQVEGDLVTLAVKPQAHEEGRRYLLRELPAGLVERRIRLPEAVNPSKAKAALENGLLTVRLPKAEHLLPKHIKVKAR